MWRSEWKTDNGLQKNLIAYFSDVFSDEPSYSSSIEHVMNLETTTFIAKKRYSNPHHLGKKRGNW